MQKGEEFWHGFCAEILEHKIRSMNIFFWYNDRTAYYVRTAHFERTTSFL